MLSRGALGPWTRGYARDRPLLLPRGGHAVRVLARKEPLHVLPFPSHEPPEPDRYHISHLPVLVQLRGPPWVSFASLLPLSLEPSGILLNAAFDRFLTRADCTCMHYPSDYGIPLLAFFLFEFFNLFFEFFDTFIKLLVSFFFFSFRTNLLQEIDES